MLDGSVSSKAKVEIPRDDRSDMEEVLRAVARTRRPREWNWRASAWPMPPGLQPVTKTLFLESAISYSFVYGCASVKVDEPRSPRAAFGGAFEPDAFQ